MLPTASSERSLLFCRSQSRYLYHNTAKDEPVSTGFKAAKDLIIDMNEHLTLTADKYSYEQFPKVLIMRIS